MERIITYFMMFFISLLVFGCATQAQQRAQATQQIIDDGLEKYRICKKDMKFNPSVEYVLQEIVVEHNNSSNKYNLLASTQKLNNDMKVHFINYLDENAKCRAIFSETASKVHPSLLLPAINAWRFSDNLYGKFLASEITIGELNRQLGVASNEFDKEFSNAVNNFNAALASDHYREIQSMQQAATALQNNRPRNTNCNMTGNFLNCTSY